MGLGGGYGTKESRSEKCSEICTPLQNQTSGNTFFFLFSRFSFYAFPVGKDYLKEGQGASIIFQQVNLHH